jgi:hypothetical protein
MQSACNNYASVLQSVEAVLHAPVLNDIVRDLVTPSPQVSDAGVNRERPARLGEFRHRNESAPCLFETRKDALALRWIGIGIHGIIEPRRLLA